MFSIILLAMATVVILFLLAVGKVPLSYILRNVTVRWKTTLLTALAFTLVIGLLTVMLAFVNGMKRLTDGTGEPGNVIVLSDGSIDEVFSNLNVDDIGQIEMLEPVQRDPATGRSLASRETFCVVNQPVANPQDGRPNRRFLQVRGLDDPHLAATIHNVSLFPGGTWFSQAGVQDLPGAGKDGQETMPVHQAVLGEGVARELALDRTPEQLATARNRARLEPGDTFVLGNRTWVVTGVLQSANSTFNSEVWAKRSLLAALFGKETYTTLVVRTADEAQGKQFASFLQNDYSKVRVAAQTELDYYASMSETSRQFLWAIGFVAAIMAIGGMFGVMNTMFAAISQRIKDIGVLRLLGYGRRQILIAFLLESLVIALLGGLLGCGLGMLANGWSATSVISSHQGGGRTVIMTLTVDAQVISVGVILTLAMGTLGGIVPALSAMRLKPLEALR